MYKNNKIAIAIPAYNEEGLIAETLGGIPDYVDYVFVVNDGSKDDTPALIQKAQHADKRIAVVHHKKNMGLGQSLIDGYLASAKSEADITAIMAGDNQMHPDDLHKLLDKLIDHGYDYAKGNRLLHHEIDTMPKIRFLGNAALTMLTKFATGFYSIMDPQCGYTAIKNEALRNIPIARMTKGYGYNADILCMLNILGYNATDVPVRPVYGREKSKIKLWKYIPKTSTLLMRLFFRRLWKRYVVLDFHPLVLFYGFSFLTTIFVIAPLTVRFFYLFYKYREAPQTTLIILAFSIMITIQTILFAIWMDMYHNKRD